MIVNLNETESAVEVAAYKGTIYSKLEKNASTISEVCTNDQTLHFFSFFPFYYICLIPFKKMRKSISTCKNNIQSRVFG